MGTFAAEALGAAGDPSALADVLTFYGATTYLYGRFLAAESIDMLAPKEAERRAHGWLLDAERSLRWLGVELASLDEDAVRADIRRIISDPAEPQSWRREAARLLAKRTDAP